MRKIKLNTLYTTLAGLALLGSAMAQQPPAKSPTPARTTTPPASAPKTQAATPKPAEASPLSTQKDKVSYAIGMSVGGRLHDDLSRQSIDADDKLLVQGFQDALSGGKTLMTADEARTLLTQFQAEVRAKMEEKQKLAAETNKKEGDEFLAANKAKPGVVTLPSGLQYKILTPGTGPKPTAEDSVVCNYRGTLINGKEFDSSYKRGEPATFPVSRVIKGWTEALQLMPVGSKWQLFVPSDLAYGPRGASAEIGPNATLIFEVELLSIQEKEKPAVPAPTPKPAAPPEKKPAPPEKK
jgi:FKBP-type peptidyl-prolyl cis-trans isomerase FklB